MPAEKVGKVTTIDELKSSWHPAFPYAQDPRIETWIISEEKSWELLEGFIDSHCHGAPEAWWPHRPSILQTCIDASKAGMKAILFKDHYTITSDRAYIIQEYLDRRAAEDEGFTPAQIYGSVTLNYAVGGLNPEAVRKALSGDFGKYTKCIWMPSTNSAWLFKCMGREKGTKLMGKEGGISILDKGKLKPEVKEIIEIVANAPTKVAISTSHLSVEEGLVLAEAGKAAGVDIVVCHASQELTVVTLEEAREFVKLGAWIELSQCSVMGTPIVGLGMGINWEHSMRLIKEIGPSHIILSTDAGQPGNPPVWAAMMLIRALMAHGISEDDVNIMAKKNPAKAFGIV